MDDLDVRDDPASAGSSRRELALAQDRVVETSQPAGHQQVDDVAARALDIGGLGRQAARAQ